MTRLKLSFFLMIIALAIANAESYKRIVSLAPSLTNMIYLLQSQDNLVGCTSYCEDGKVDNKAIVASAVEINVEKVFLLQPDLIITAGLTKPSIIAKFEEAGIKVKVFPSAKSYSELCNQLREIAILTGKEEVGKKIIERQQKRLADLKKSIPPGEKPKVFFQIGAKPLFTVIPNTFMDDFITFSGGINIASDLKSGTITRESVIVRNPDVIIIVTMGIAGEEEKIIWEKNRSITASKNGKIFIIDSNKACSPNPVTFIDVVEQLISLMYK